MHRVDKLEKFMNDLYQLSKSDQYALESVQQLQRLAVDSIIVEELRSQVLNEPGTPPPSRFDCADRAYSDRVPKALGNEGARSNNEYEDETRYSFQLHPEHSSAMSSTPCSPFAQVTKDSCEMACSNAVDEQSQLDSDDLTDAGEEEGPTPDEGQLEAYSALSQVSSQLSYQGASTSPQYNHSTSSSVSSSLCGVRSLENE
ncbi:hypothetical protein GE061_017381 [Apolygus lucorum]|uniref:Uncharacterized protein n=2 Tax=Apolygus lucorum TaxID=248454 RepID=A0A8S9XDJ9_APOLU|nr:hypothetical protein GE061_017381 [Apolygus lucorum]